MHPADVPLGATMGPPAIRCLIEMTDTMAPLVHPSAIVDDGAVLGAGTRVWHFAHVCSGAKIGRACSLGQNVFVGNRAVLGDNVRVQNNVSIYDDVTLEDDVFCGPSMVFTNVINPRTHVSRKSEYRPPASGREHRLAPTPPLSAASRSVATRSWARAPS